MPAWYIWQKKFPDTSPLAIDLLSKLLCFDPKQRITVQQAIKHDYFKPIIALENPPVSQIHFNWEWESKFAHLLTHIPFVKKLIYLESESFHPEETDKATPQKSKDEAESDKKDDKKEEVKADPEEENKRQENSN